MGPRPKIVVVGSLNVDHTFRVPRIPAPGETLTSSSAMLCLGGKGANQAVAAARAGGEVSLVGAVGWDDFGSRYLAHLQEEGIDITRVHRCDAPTGSAFIAVDDAGENCIIVNPGANHEITAAYINGCRTILESSDVLLLQLECPLPAVARAAEIAHAAGVRVILNPSPWQAGCNDVGLNVDVLIVNEQEAAELTGSKLGEALANPAAVCSKARCSVIVITRGGDSTIALSGDGKCIEVMPPPVEPVDTVGAGDTFSGAFAVAMAEGCGIADCIAFANAAGALATLKPGAQAAIPTRAQIEQNRM